MTILLNFAVSLPLKAARWRMALPKAPPFAEALAATLEGLLANAAVGFGSGDLVRAARLRGAGRDLAIDYACTWAERGAEALALAVMIFVAALLTNLGPFTLVLSGLGVVVYLGLLVLGRLLAPRLSWWPRAQTVLSSVLEASTPRRVAAIAGLSLLGWVTESAMLVAFQWAFHLDPSFRTALLTLAGINAAIVIPTLPGNFGTFEAGAAIGLVASGVPREVAVAYALIYHLSHVVPVTVVAIAVYVVRSSAVAGREAGD